MRKTVVVAAPICCSRKELEVTFATEFKNCDELRQAMERYMDEHQADIEAAGYDPESMTFYTVSEIVDMINDDALLSDNYWYVDVELTDYMPF